PLSRAALLPGRTAAQIIVSFSALPGVPALISVAAPGALWLFLATPLFGFAIGISTTAAYTAAAGVLPAGARGAGFGLLTTASLAGLAISPIVSGLLGATSIRAVWALDVVSLAALAIAVHRLQTDSTGDAQAPREEPVPENL